MDEEALRLLQDIRQRLERVEAQLETNREAVRALQAELDRQRRDIGAVLQAVENATPRFGNF